MENYRHIIECVNTFHGEFPFPGRICTLLRFRSCNLSCDFCDTKEAMWTKTSVFTSDYELYRKLGNLLSNTRNLLITGGEPGLYTTSISSIIDYLFVSDIFVETIQIETNGLLLDRWQDLYSSFRKSIVYSLSNLLFVIWSPKFVSEEETEKNFTRLYETFNVLKSITYIKLLDNPEWEQIVDSFIKLAVKLYGETVKKRISLMPVTKNDTTEYKSTIEKCLKWGINLSPRLHLMLRVP